MTRLTPEMIKDVPMTDTLEGQLMDTLGIGLLGLSAMTAGLPAERMGMSGLTAAVIPITSGEGVIGGFSESIKAVLDSMGIQTYMTRTSDVAGFYDAMKDGPDMIFMADDDQFVAYNTKAAKCVDNTEGTARGYLQALRLAAGGLKNRTVLIVGCGRIGTFAASILSNECETVNVVDIDRSRSARLESMYGNVHAYTDTETAVRENTLILNASPGHIDTEWIAPGSIIASPGVPNPFGEEARRKALIVHDPLAIGVGSMAAICAGYSIRGVAPQMVDTEASNRTVRYATPCSQNPVFRIRSVTERMSRRE
ncbi:MAG: 3-methylornithyl-N6-L-lysine dehydrogenase PylD [Candidatus Methanomethylophilaceae archaeon]